MEILLITKDLIKTNFIFQPKEIPKEIKKDKKQYYKKYWTIFEKNN